MNIATEDVAGGVRVVRLDGRLDLLSANAVKAELQGHARGERPRLIVDLSSVGFVDSSGLGALIAGLKAARQAGGDLRLTGLGEQARMIFELTSLDRVLRSYPSIEEALVNF